MDGCSTQDIVVFIVWNPPSLQVRWVMTTVREKRMNALWYAWSHPLTSKNIMSQDRECLCTRLHGDGWGFISVYDRKALSKCEKYVNESIFSISIIISPNVSSHIRLPWWPLQESLSLRVAMTTGWVATATSMSAKSANDSKPTRWFNVNWMVIKNPPEAEIIPMFRLTALSHREIVQFIRDGVIFCHFYYDDDHDCCWKGLICTLEGIHWSECLHFIFELENVSKVCTSNGKPPLSVTWTCLLNSSLLSSNGKIEE